MRNKLEGFESASKTSQSLFGIDQPKWNDTIIRGTLESADQLMSLILTDATVEPLQQPKKFADFLFLKGKHIRYVHMASSIDPTSIIEQTRNRIRQAKLLHQRTIDPLTAAKGIQE
ncbi:hypothetical protein WJX74_007517 [Apatococcus lobatus]|uniref:Sm domain-containing protein n=1 Tax=Apatococcus lobatus TaxID=904363 RepID=A0AAW1RNW4_9CHLO